MSTTFFRFGKTNPSQPIVPLGASFATTSPAASPIRLARSKKILVVDDDPIILKTVSLKLTSQGYDVVTATDASGAIAAVRDEKPHLVILDLSFPPDIASGGRVTWDGFQIMSWLRGFGEAGNVPFIIITSGDPAEYKQRSLANGAIAFFHKPIDHDDLLPAIQRGLANHTGPSEGTVSGDSGI
jgi:CheY-like chemotaxis protein